MPSRIDLRKRHGPGLGDPGRRWDPWGRAARRKGSEPP